MSAPSTPPPPPSGAGAPVPGLPMPGSAAVLPKSDYDRRVSPSPVQLNYLLPSQSEIHLIWNHKMYNTSKSSEVENWTRLVTDILEDLRRKQEAWGQPNFRGRRRRVDNDMPFGSQNSSIPLIIGTSNASAGGNGINPSTSASQITTTTITLPNSVSGVAGDGAVPPPPPGDASSSANGDTILISPNAPPMPVPSSHSGSGPSSSTTTIHVVSSNASGAGSTTTSVPLVITTSTPLGGGMASSSSALSNRDVSCDNKECDHNIPFMIACSSTVFTGDVDIAEVVSAESWRKQPYWNGRPHLPHNRTTKLHVVVKENKRRLEYTLHVNLSSTTGVNGKRRDTRAKCIILPLPDLRDSQKRPIYAVMQPPPFRARGSVYLTMEGWARLDLLRSNAEFEVFIFNNEENLPITVELGWCGRNPTTYPVDAARRKRKRERTKGMGPVAPAPAGFDAAAWRSMLATFAPALAAAAAGSTPAGVTSPTLSGKTGEEKTAGGKKRKGAAAAAAAAAAANPGGIMIRPFQWPVDANAPESERKTNILSMVAGSFLTNAAGGQGLPIMKLENGVPVPVGLAFSPGARAAGATDASGDSSAAASSSSDASGATSVVGVTSSTDGVAADGSAAAAAGTNAQQQFVLIPFPAGGAAGFPTIFPFPQMFPVNSQGKISMILPGAGTDGSVVSAEAGAAGDQGDEKGEAKSPTLKGKKKGGRKGKGAKRARKTRRGKDEEDGGDDSADAETESDRESGSDDDEDKKKDDEDESHRRGGRKRGRGAEAAQEHHAMPEGLGDPHGHHQ